MLKFTLIIFIIYFGTSECGMSRNGGPNSNYVFRFAGTRNRQLAAAAPPPSTTSIPMTPKEFLQSQGTFSAWSLILIIILVIVSCLAVYYIALCYPFFCHHHESEKNYLFMDGSSSTITAETSPSMPSIENFSNNEKSMDQQYSTHNEKSINDYIIHESGPPPLQMGHKSLELK